MGENRGPYNWYDLRRQNRRALKNRARKQLKRSNRTGSNLAPELPILNLGVESETVQNGVIAGLLPPLYSILTGDRLISARSETPAQFNALRKLAVGDQVLFDCKGDGSPTLTKLLPRRSWLSRLRADSTRISLAGADEHVLAANVDLAVIVVSAVSPPFHPRLVDRYLIMCQYGQVQPLLCITKIDLAEMPDVSLYKALGLNVVAVSNKTRVGLDLLFSAIDGKCCVLTGHSGVGKSSIVNALLEQEMLPVKSVSDKTGKGRHTTVSTSLHVLGPQTYLIDTPGIRSLGLWNIEPETLRLYFREFAPFANHCRYRDCAHSSEPDCAVRNAAKSGLISAERYDSYLRLLLNIN